MERPIVFVTPNITIQTNAVNSIIWPECSFNDGHLLTI
jgi:hypothetical protein